MSGQPNHEAPRRRLVHAVVGFGIAAMAVAALGYGAIEVKPSIGADAADALRSVIGDDAVAHLESAIYGAKDELNQESYSLGLKSVESPWVTVTTGDSPAVTSASPPTDKSDAGVSAQGGAAVRATVADRSAARPQDLIPFSATPGEGRWQDYIATPLGQEVAWRTFLAPDPQRPYAVVGLVAFDLTRTRLNFVLGTQEPQSAVAISRTGKIPAEDALPGKLVAVFNGGWKSQHGHFGTMSNGVIAAPAKPGLMTLALDSDGSLRMGVWGEDTPSGPRTIAWRQNNVPLIHRSQINPKTDNMSISDWGSALDGSVAVWRSGVGLSADGKTLFYAAGDGVLVSTLAKALKTAGSAEAMQLDVNNYWVHFDAVRAVGGGLQAEPLFDAMRKQDNERYLKGFLRDYFYVTVK